MKAIKMLNGCFMDSAAFPPSPCMQQLASGAADYKAGEKISVISSCFLTSTKGVEIRCTIRIRKVLAVLQPLKGTDSQSFERNKTLVT